MNYLHTMLRITDIEESLDFFCNKFGLIEKDGMKMRPDVLR